MRTTCQCGGPTSDATTRADRRLGVERRRCVRCGAEQEVALDVPDPPLDPAPTAAAPGSRKKVSVLVARARAGLALFHPLDAAFGEVAGARVLPGGVSRWRRKWRARAYDALGDKVVHLGLYDTEEEAAGAVAAYRDGGG